HGVVADVRTREREQRPAGFRRAALRREQSRRRQVVLGERIPATVHQGVEFRSKGEPVLFVSNPDGLTSDTRRATLAPLKDLNSMGPAEVGVPEINTRIAAYEMAYRMQTSVPELTDISKEPPKVHEMYGTRPGQTSFANNCLLARRLIERGVRFVQLYHW